MVQVLVYVIAFLIPPPPATTAAPSAPSAPVAAFTANQLFDTDNGTTITRLGVSPVRVYLFRPGSRLGSIVNVRHRECCQYDAALSPGADLVAYTTIDERARLGDRGEPGWGVFVVDTAGREVAAFPRGRRLRWSPDGRRLAILYADHDTNWTWAPTGIGIWRRSDGRLERLDLRPADVRWGDGDTLYLANPDGVDAFDLESRRVSRTIHGGPDISPDRRFSVSHGLWFARRMQVYQDRDGLLLTHCALYRHNADEVAAFDPFWVRAPGARHLLCLGAGDSWNAPVGQAGFRTGLFDPRTLEIARWFPGKPVVPTADQRGVVVLRGDTLAVESLDPTGETVATGSTVRVRVEVAAWGGAGGVSAIAGGKPPVAKSWTHEVAEGEWLSDHTGMHGACDQFFQVARIFDRDSIEVVFAPGRYTVYAPGAAPTEATTAVISRHTTVFRTNSDCGGYDARLTIAD